MVKLRGHLPFDQNGKVENQIWLNLLCIALKYKVCTNYITKENPFFFSITSAAKSLRSLEWFLFSLFFRELYKISDVYMPIISWLA